MNQSLRIISTAIASLIAFPSPSVAQHPAPPSATLADSIDSITLDELIRRVSRTSITALPTSRGVRELSLSLQDAAGVRLSVIGDQVKTLPVMWETSNASCVAFVAETGTSPTAIGISVATKSFGCPATITARVGGYIRDVGATAVKTITTQITLR